MDEVKLYKIYVAQMKIYILSRAKGIKSIIYHIENIPLVSPHSRG